jgi:hypothetical protein
MVYNLNKQWFILFILIRPNFLAAIQVFKERKKWLFLTHLPASM